MDVNDLRSNVHYAGGYSEVKIWDITQDLSLLEVEKGCMMMISQVKKQKITNILQEGRALHDAMLTFSSFSSKLYNTAGWIARL